MTVRTGNIFALWFLIVQCSVAVLGQTPLTNRATAETVPLLPRWTQGEKLTFELVKTRQKMQNGQVTSKDGTRTDLEIEVLLASKKGYVVKWSLGETKFDDPNQAALLGKEMTDLTKKGSVMIFEIDANGSITGIQNWRELMANYVKVTEVMIKQMEAAGADKEQIAGVRKVMSSLTKEQIEAMSSIEAQLFYMALGQKYVLSEPINYAVELPNAFGGQPFPAKAAYTLKAIDVKLGKANVRWTESIDPEKGRVSIESTLKGLGELMGKPMPEGYGVGSLSIDDTAEISVDIPTGWTDRLKYSRLIKVAIGSGPNPNTMTQEDSTTIARKIP